MSLRNNLRRSFLILNNAIIKKKRYISVHRSKLNLILLRRFKEVGLINNYYFIKGANILIVFNHPYGRPVWNVKTMFNKPKIGKYKTNNSLFSNNFSKGVIFLVNNNKGIWLKDSFEKIQNRNEIICIFYK